MEFLDAHDLSFRVDNLTDGAMTDAEAKGVAVAAVRRGAAEGWAARHFRFDVVGAGTAHGRKDVRWDVVGEIAVSWMLTLPVTVALGYGYGALMNALVG